MHDTETKQTHMAATLYFPAISWAASTSHLRKLTVLYCFESASKVGAMAWQGPHLVETTTLLNRGESTVLGDPAYHVAWKSMTYNPVELISKCLDTSEGHRTESLSFEDVRIFSSCEREVRCVMVDIRDALAEVCQGCQSNVAGAGPGMH